VKFVCSPEQAEASEEFNVPATVLSNTVAASVTLSPWHWVLKGVTNNEWFPG
jgi:hypothetical protein